MAIVGKVPQAFIVHRENPRHSQNEHLFPVPSLLKNPLAKNSYLHLPVCFIFRWRQLRKARMGRAVWGSNVVGLKVQQLHSARQPRCPRTQVVVLHSHCLAFKSRNKTLAKMLEIWDRAGVGKEFMCTLNHFSSAPPYHF